MRVLNPWVVGVAIALFGAGLGGCSLALDFDCAEDGDCANLEGSFVCSGGACVANQFACTDEQPLVGGECYDIYGPLASNPGANPADREAAYLANPTDYELIAITLPSSGFAASGKVINEVAIHFAIDHINANGGLAYGADLGEHKQLAALICNDAGSGEDASGVGIRAATHAATCGAKALVSTYSSTLTVDIFREAAKVFGIPMIAPGAISPQIPDARQNLGDEGLLWRIKVPGRTLIQGSVGLINDRGYRNVHIFYRGATLYDKAMKEALELALGGGNSTAHDLTGAPGASAAAVAAILNATDPKPDVVVTVVEDLGDLLDVASGMIESARDGGLVADLITIEGARSEQAINTIFLQTNNDPAVFPVACRAMGVSSGSINNGGAGTSDDVYQNWLTLFGSQVTSYEPNITDVAAAIVAPTAAYVDAVFVTAYAIAAAVRKTNGGPFGQDEVIDGLKLLSDPNGREVRPHKWGENLDALGANGTTAINYNGASGTIDLDEDTQDVSGRQIELWQYEMRGATGDARGVRDVGNLLPDDSPNFSPDAAVIQALARDPAREPECAPYPYVGLMDPE